MIALCYCNTPQQANALGETVRSASSFFHALNLLFKKMSYSLHVQIFAFILSHI